MSAEDDPVIFSGFSMLSHSEMMTNYCLLHGFSTATPSVHDDVRNLLKSLLKRVMALKELLLAQNDVEKKFHIELHLLECKYNKYYMDNYNKRNDIVNGIYEPTEEECDFPSDDENYDGKNVFVDKERKIQLIHSKPATPKVNDGSEQIKGIPNFWLTIMKNITLISDSIQPYDELILSYLTDIKIHLSEDPIGFTLKFCFSPNKWFTNTVLTKEYEMEFVKDEINALDCKGLKIYKSKGCTIQWNKGMNVTVKVVKKVENCVVKKGEYPFQMVEKAIFNPSFFHFFSPPTVPDVATLKVKRRIGRVLAMDYEIGYYIHERVIPRAVLYYTGEALIDAIEIDQEESECDSEHESNFSIRKSEETTNRPESINQCRQQ